PRPTSMTDLPTPRSDVAEALSEYAAAVRAEHDGDWGAAQRHPERATQLHPSFSAAYLRMTVILAQASKFKAAERAAYAQALHGRNLLSERDQALLYAYE